MTASRSAEAVVRSAVAQLRSDLDGHHQVVDLSERGERRITRAIDWLISVRHGEGYWGYRSPAVTATCTLAIALWRPAEAEVLLGPNAQWLLTQADDGRWETVWDSGAAVAAIYAAGVGTDPRSRAAMQRLASQQPEESTGRPHHCAQVLAASMFGDWVPTMQDPWVDRIVEDLDTRVGCYVLGQAVFGLLSAGRPPSEMTDVLGHLADHLHRIPWSTATFLDHAASLRALARAETHTDVVERAVDGLFGSAYRRDGSWYHDPWYTAWALLALHETSSVRRVVIEQPCLDDYLARAERSIDAVRKIEQHRDITEWRARVWVMVGTVLLVSGLTGTGLAVFALPESSRLFSSGLAFSSVLAVIAVAWRLLWPLLRHRKR